MLPLLLLLPLLLVVQRLPPRPRPLPLVLVLLLLPPLLLLSGRSQDLVPQLSALSSVAATVITLADAAAASAAAATRSAGETTPPGILGPAPCTCSFLSSFEDLRVARVARVLMDLLVGMPPVVEDPTQVA